MEKVIINSYEDFEKLVGQQIGVSEYVELPQERINLFADATLDHQWIHVDTERAKVESPFKSTIAHGYLTIIRKSKFPPNPERSVQFSGKRTKRSVQKIGCTQHL